MAEPERDTISIDSDIQPELFELLVRWLYSSSVVMPNDIFQVSDLFFLAFDFQVLDLMTRCENEIINKLNSTNVVQILLRFYPAKDRCLKQMGKVKRFIKEPLTQVTHKTVIIPDNEETKEITIVEPMTSLSVEVRADDAEIRD